MHASMQTTSLLWVSVPSVTSYIIMEFLRIKFPLFTKGVVLCMPVVSVKDKRKEVMRSYRLPERYILSVGTIEERKNALAIVKALEYLPMNCILFW